MPKFSVTVSLDYTVEVTARNAAKAEELGLGTIVRYTEGRQRDGDPEVMEGEFHGVDTTTIK